MVYSLRLATMADLDILDRIHTENMRSYVEKHYYWNPHLFRQNFLATEYQVIEINNKIAGFLKVVVSDTEIYLAEIQITKEFQGQGIGTSILKSIIQQAQTDQQKLWLRVLKGNRAKQLYQRLGLITQAETLTHEIMIKFPLAQA